MRQVLLLTALALLVACAPRTRESVTVAPPAEITLEPGVTYVMVTLEDENTLVGQYAACGPGAERFTVDLAFTVDCSEGVAFGRNEFIGQFRSRGRVRLSDGRMIRFMPVRTGNLAISGNDIEGGTYHIAALQHPLTGNRFFTADLPRLDLSLGQVHYIGHVAPQRLPLWRDPGDLFDAVALEIEGATPGRLVATPLQLSEKTCRDEAPRQLVIPGVGLTTTQVASCS